MRKGRSRWLSVPPLSKTSLFREQLCQSRPLKQSRTTSTLLSVRAALPCSSSEYRGFTRFFLWGREDAGLSLFSALFPNNIVRAVIAISRVRQVRSCLFGAALSRFSSQYRGITRFFPWGRKQEIFSHSTSFAGQMPRGRRKQKAPMTALFVVVNIVFV